MVGQKKKGSEGAASNYITRTRALRKLQVSLKDFRRLCILKGIYPRPPRKKLVKKHGTKTTFYHTKDIMFLAHEPVLKKFRDIKIYLRKLNKARNKGDTFKYDMLKNKKPKVVFDHLIRERYPSFEDALTDLDDPLSMVHLFSILPSGLNKELTGKRVTKLQRLRDEFQAYVAKAGCIRKAFVSIKGTYIKVNIHNLPIIFVIPHKFVHQTPTDVDYNVMSTFLDFYETLLKFAHFRLYQEVGLHYPPLVDKTLDAAALGFRRLKLESIEQAQHRLETAPEASDAKPQTIENLNEILSNVSEQKEEQKEDQEEIEKADEFEAEDSEETPQNSEDRGDLFNGLHFLLNRETPQDTLEFVIMACGGLVTRLQHALDAKDPKFTHHIVDRKVKESSLSDSRDTIQPQWVFDSLNANSLLPVNPYRPNVQPPAHLSPFVDNDKAGYEPKQALITQSWVEGKQFEDPEKVEEEEEVKGAEEEDKSEDEHTSKDDMKQLQKSVITGKRRRLINAMEMGNAKRDAFNNHLRAKRRKLDHKEN